MMLRKIWLGCASVAVPALALAADPGWPQFRGPGGASIAVDGGLPEKFAPAVNDKPAENQRWVADLPGRGLSCPTIIGGKVFLTANSGMDQSRLHALAYDAATGKKLWERQFWTTGQTLCHPKTCMACPTVATDGKLIYCLFATGDLVCLTTDGDVRWLRSLSIDYPKMTNHVGRSSSPVLAGEVLAVLMENQGESYLLGLDAGNGATRWQAARPLNNNWVTPIAVDRNGATELLVQSQDGITAYDAKTGSTKWSFSDESFSPIPSSAASGADLILAPGLPRGIVALKPSGVGAEVVWKTLKLGAATASPFVADGKVFALSNSILTVGQLTDGKVLWDLRVKGPFSASPIFADGKIYLVNEDGAVTIVKPGDTEGKIVGNCELKETVLATPAVADGAIFFRSDKHLWCFGKDRKKS